MSAPSQNLEPLRILYDFSKYQEYIFQNSPTGISRVDMEYARHFSQHGEHLFAALHSRYGISTKFGPQALGRLVHRVEQEWSKGNRKDIGGQVRAWLRGENPGLRRVTTSDNPRLDFARKAALFGFSWPHHQVFRAVPQGAIYLNASYASLSYRRMTDWLRKRSDIRAAYMLHDLLPLTRPELFWEGIDSVFPRQIDAILARSDLILVPSEMVKQSVLDLAGTRGRKDINVEVIPLPPAPEFLAATSNGERSGLPPYFVICGTIEPRKNHAKLLKIWEAMVHGGGPVPKLLVIGHRGWKYEATVEKIASSAALHGHVLEVTGLSPDELCALVRGARALLMPSEAEGYGMPIVEALTVGTPVIASEIPVFRAISQSCATLLPLDDDHAWAAAIRDHASEDIAFPRSRMRAREFQASTWDRYFGMLHKHLRDIRKTPSPVA